MNRTSGSESAAHTLVCSLSAPFDRWEAADGDGVCVEQHPSMDAALSRLCDRSVDAAVLDERNLNTESAQKLADILVSDRCPPIVIIHRELGSITAHPNLVDCCFAVVGESCERSTLKSLAIAAARFGSLQREHRRLGLQLKNRIARELPGRSAAVQQLCQDVARTALADGTILLQGERGTGLPELACSVHDHSRRAHRPFLRVDCRVHTAELLERELFGTGVLDGDQERPRGAFERASGGTVCLEDIDALAAPFQRKLQRILERGTYHVPDTTEIRTIDARVALVQYEDAASSGSYLVDFISVQPQTCRLRSTPLRDRLEDVGVLVEHHLTQLARREGRLPACITVEGLQLLQSHDWPGNTQELQRVLECACVIDPGPRLTADMLSPWLSTTPAEPLGRATGKSLREMERKLIEATFTRCGGNRERTAQILQIGLRTLSGKLREYGYPPRGGPGSNRRPEQRRAA